MQAVLYFIRSEIGSQCSGIAVGEVCSFDGVVLLDFLHRLNFRVGSAQEKRIAIV